MKNRNEQAEMIMTERPCRDTAIPLAAVRPVTTLFMLMSVERKISAGFDRLEGYINNDRRKVYNI